MRRAALLLVLLMVATTSLTGYALAEEDEGYPDAVSYTHLTLPTISRV